jgi:hypothetical protein
VAVHAIAEPPQRVQPESPKGSVSVRVDNDADDSSTVLTLEADSRPGLLTALTGTFKALGLEVVKASVDARNGRISDTFHVQDAFGAKITPGDAVNVKRSLEVGGACAHGRMPCAHCSCGCLQLLFDSSSTSCCPGSKRWLHLQAVLKANPGMKSSSKRPNLLMTAGIGVAERDEKKEHLYSLMGGYWWRVLQLGSMYIGQSDGRIK